MIPSDIICPICHNSNNIKPAYSNWAYTESFICKTSQETKYHYIFHPNNREVIWTSNSEDKFDQVKFSILENKTRIKLADDTAINYSITLAGRILDPIKLNKIIDNFNIFK